MSHSSTKLMVAKRPDQVHQRCHRPTRQLLWGGSAATAGQVAAINPCTDGQAHLVSTPFCSTADSGRRLPLRRPPRRSRRLRDLGCTAPAPRAIASRIQSIFRTRMRGTPDPARVAPLLCASVSHRAAPHDKAVRCGGISRRCKVTPPPPSPRLRSRHGACHTRGWRVGCQRCPTSVLDWL